MQEKHLGEKANWSVAIGIILVLIAIVLILWFFMHGETRLGGEWTIEQTSSLTCEATGIEYPFFEYDNSREKTVKINSTREDEDVKAISLIYNIKYDNEKSIIDSENLNHLAMNKKFADDGLEFDALGLKFSRFSDGLQMSLFANSDQINGKTAKYFMLDETSNISPVEIQKVYETKGFICQRKN